MRRGRLNRREPEALPRRSKALAGHLPAAFFNVILSGMRISEATAAELGRAFEAAVKPPHRSSFEQIYGAPEAPGGRSQMLFFLKPELMRSPRLSLVVELVVGALAAHELAVESVVVLSGRYLEEHGVVAEHYGVIDAVARDPRANLSEQARARFRELYGHDPDQRVIGGLAYLAGHPALDAEALAKLWLGRGADKLAGGTYCQPLPAEGLYLVNGFYPRMLRHFTAPASRVAGFVLRGDVPWAAARQRFCGATDPARALAASLRAELLRRQRDLALAEVSANLNGVHLSAGPLEALVELRRFASDLSVSPRPLEDFAFGRALSRRFDAATVQALVGNPTVATPSGARSAFDLTEEKEPDEALDILATVAGALRG